GGREPAQEAAEAASSLRLALERSAEAVARWGAASGGERLAVRLGELSRQAGAQAEELRAIEAPEGEPLPRLPYEALLARRHGVALAELLEWHEAEIEAGAERFRAVAAAIEPGADPHALLEARSPAYASAQEMFAAAREYLALARKRSLDYVTLPA